MYGASIIHNKHIDVGLEEEQEKGKPDNSKKNSTENVLQKLVEHKGEDDKSFDKLARCVVKVLLELTPEEKTVLIHRQVGKSEMHQSFALESSTHSLENLQNLYQQIKLYTSSKAQPYKEFKDVKDAFDRRVKEIIEEEITDGTQKLEPQRIHQQLQYFLHAKERK